MHDIDRTYLEYEPESEAESEAFEFGESQWPGAAGEVFSDTEVMELASGFMEISDEGELDQFLGSLIKKAGRVLGKVVKSPVGQALGGILKGAARQALPVLGSALGGYVGGPEGAQLGSQLATGAARKFGLETEGLSHEDEAFEVAKQYVRFAGETVKNAVAAPPGDPQAVAQSAATQAARTHAPGLLRGARQSMAPAPGFARGRGGRWVRRGNRIILYGV